MEELVGDREEMYVLRQHMLIRTIPRVGYLPQVLLEWPQGSYIYIPTVPRYPLWYGGRNYGRVVISGCQETFWYGKGTENLLLIIIIIITISSNQSIGLAPTRSLSFFFTR